MSRRRISKFEGIDPFDYVSMYERVRIGYFWYNGRRMEVKALPGGFWNKDSSIEVIRYFILKIQKWNREEFAKKLSNKILLNNGLAGAVKFFRGSPYNITKNCFPEWNIHPWELNNCPTNYLNNKKHCRKIMQWIAAKENIHRDKKKFCEKMSTELFAKYGLTKAVRKMGGIYNYVNYVYPGKYKKWDLNVYRVDDELVIEATKWMIEEELKWSFEDVCNNISAKTFYDNGLASILSHGCKNSPIIALKIAYPGVYTKDMLVKGRHNPFKK